MCEFCEKIYDEANYDTLYPYIYHGASHTDGSGYGYHITVPGADGRDYTIDNILFCPYCRRELSKG